MCICARYIVTQIGSLPILFDEKMGEGYVNITQIECNTFRDRYYGRRARLIRKKSDEHVRRSYALPRRYGGSFPLAYLAISWGASHDHVRTNDLHGEPCIAHNYAVSVFKKNYYGILR